MRIILKLASFWHLILFYWGIKGLKSILEKGKLLAYALNIKGCQVKSDT